LLPKFVVEEELRVGSLLSVGENLTKTMEESFYCAHIEVPQTEACEGLLRDAFANL
jgi:hypothetical protein